MSKEGFSEVKYGRRQGRTRIMLGIKTHSQQAQTPDSTACPLRVCITPLSLAWLCRSSKVPSAYAQHGTQSILIPLITIYIHTLLILGKLLFE